MTAGWLRRKACNCSVRDHQQAFSRRFPLTLTKKEACKLLGISPRTLERRMASGRYTFTRTGEGQFAELSFTHTGIGLPEPAPVVEPVPVVEDQPETEPAFAPSPLARLNSRRKQISDSQRISNAAKLLTALETRLTARMRNGPTRALKVSSASVRTTTPPIWDLALWIIKST